jgi:hypothetical protein
MVACVGLWRELRGVTSGSEGLMTISRVECQQDEVSCSVALGSDYGGGSVDSPANNAGCQLFATALPDFSTKGPR